MLRLVLLTALLGGCSGVASSTTPPPPDPTQGQLPQYCGGCLIAPLNPQSVSSGPCVSVHTRSLCALNTSPMGCPAGFNMCPSNEWMPMPNPGAPLVPISMSLSNLTVQISMGEAVVFYLPNNTRNFSVCSGTPNTSIAPARGDGQYFSGVLPPTQKFWNLYPLPGRYRYYDCYRPEFFGVVVVRPMNQPQPLSFFIPIRYDELGPGFLARILSAIDYAMNTLLAAVPNGTLVYNVSITESPRGGVRVTIQFDTSGELQTVNSSLNTITFNATGTIYTASSTDESPTTVLQGDSSTGPSYTGPAAGGGGGGLLIIYMIYMLKRRRLADRPLKAEYTRDFELEEMGPATDMDPTHPMATLPFLDHRGFAEIHYSVVKGDKDAVQSLLHSDGTPDSGVSPASNAVSGPDTSPWNASDPASQAWDSPATNVPSPTAAVLNAYGIRLVDLPDARGNTPLVWAVRLGDLAMCQVLIANHCNVAAANSQGQTALHFACAAGAVDIVKALLAAGAPVDALDVKGATPLWDVCVEGRADLATLLLAAGANVNSADVVGMTPLMVAVSRGHIECMRVLLAEPTLQPADKNAQGWSALHWAVAVGEIEGLKWLLAHRRVRIAVINNNGETPLHLAAREGNLQMVQLLLGGRKRDVLRVMLPATTNDGLSALDYARSHHQDECAALLEALIAAHMPPARSSSSGASGGGVVRGGSMALPGAAVETASVVGSDGAAAAAATAGGSVAGQGEGDSGVDEFGALEDFDPALLAGLDSLDPASQIFSFPFDNSTSRTSVFQSPPVPSPPLPALASVAAAAAAMAWQDDAQQDPLATSRRAHKREYMRDRRREQRDQEREWEDKVADMDRANKQLASELEMMRAEAARLRTQLHRRQQEQEPQGLIAVTAIA